jgi:hypothetical protein
MANIARALDDFKSFLANYVFLQSSATTTFLNRRLEGRAGGLRQVKIWWEGVIVVFY